jgi:Putative adhesin
MEVFDTPGSVSLQFRLPSGRVVVTTADQPQTSVELVPLGRGGHDAIEAVEVTCRERAGGHVITVDEKERIRWGPIRISWGGNVEVRVVCPHGADLELSAGSTDLRVTGELGEVSARTASGDIQLDTVQDKIAVKTASGDISIGTIQDGGSAGTVSGDLGIRQVEGALTARSVSGDVRIGSLQAPLILSTTSGDIELEAVEAGDVRLQSVSGDIRVGVRRGTRVFIDAASVSGDLVSELGVSDDRPAASEEEDGNEEVVPLHVKTVSGDVKIVSAARVSA